MRRWLRPTAALLGLVLLGGCANTIERLTQVGQPPELTPIENPAAQASYRPVSLPMPAQEPEIYRPTRCGARARARSSRTSGRVPWATC
jgi:flagellar L-ring protein precursor FlgH